MSWGLMTAVLIQRPEAWRAPAEPAVTQLRLSHPRQVPKERGIRIPPALTPAHPPVNTDTFVKATLSTKRKNAFLIHQPHRFTVCLSVAFQIYLLAGGLALFRCLGCMKCQSHGCILLLPVGSSVRFIRALK